MIKVLDLNSLQDEILRYKCNNKKIVATNGCFDVLHVGHISYLKAAKRLGDILVVGINDDLSVKALKGNNRPINNQDDRAEILSSLYFVDIVYIFSGITADKFLNIVAPDIYVKGGDYTFDTLNKKEKEAVEDNGGIIVLLPQIKGISTTNILSKI